MVVARFQGDDRAPSAGAVTRDIECLGFGVRLALSFVVALADELPAGIEDYAANRRVGAGRAEPERGECDGSPHAVTFES
jgi:hypothetical protein